MQARQYLSKLKNVQPKKGNMSHDSEGTNPSKPSEEFRFIIFKCPNCEAKPKSNECDHKHVGQRELGNTPNKAHQCATPAATLSSMKRPSRNRSSPKGAASGPGASLATISAMAQPEPGMALNPPVPQPQLM